MRQFDSIQDLTEEILNAWSHVPKDYLEHLVSSIKDRISEVLIKNGGATHY